MQSIIVKAQRGIFDRVESGKNPIPFCLKVRSILEDRFSSELEEAVKNYKFDVYMSKKFPINAKKEKRISDLNIDVLRGTIVISTIDDEVLKDKIEDPDDFFKKNIMIKEISARANTLLYILAFTDYLDRILISRSLR